MAPSGSLERALLLLKRIEQTPGGLRNADISHDLKIPKSTCTYILSRLEREGYVAREADTGRYKIGLATVALAHGALREIGIRSVAEPALYRLTSETGLSAGIGVLQGSRVLLVDRVEGPRFVDRAMSTKTPYRIRSQRDIGRELPLHSTALGKVLLAHLPRAQASRLMMLRGGAKTRFLAGLDLVREQGYAIADGEVYADLRALSVPIFDSQPSVRAAVSVNGSPSEPVWSELEELVKRVQDAARDIARRARF